MANTIQIKRSSTASDVPTAGQLVEGELAIATNPADRKLYSKDSGGTVFEIGGGGAGDVTAGSHADNQIAVWTSTANEIEGASDFTWDGATFRAAGTLLDVNNSGAATAVSMMGRNSAGGVNLNVNATTGDAQIGQISGAGAAEDIWLKFNRNAQVDVYYNNAVTLSSALYTESDFGTGAKVVDGLNTMQPVGFNVMPVYEIDVDDTFDLAHNGMMWHRDAGTTVNFTCNSDTTIPIGATYVVHNEGTDSIEITAGTASVLFLSAGAAAVSGSVTVEQGGLVTVYKYADAEFWVWGDIQAAPLADLADLNDVNITSPADASLLIYDTGTLTWRDYIMSGDASMTDAGVVTVANNSHTHTLSNISDVTATAAEVNLLDLAGLTAGWVLSADTATTASWKASVAATELNGLSDVNITTVNDDNFLIYDSGTGMWRNYDISGDIVINDVGVSTAQASIISGRSASGALVSTDDFLVLDGGVLSQCDVGDLQTYMQANLTFSGGSVTSVTAGNGMVFTDITTTGAVTMGTPGQLTGASTNAVTGTSHTHAITTTGTGDIVAAISPSFTGTPVFAADLLADAVGVNTDPGPDNARFSGYGIMGARSTFYVSNVDGAVALNHTGVHNTNTKLATSASGVTVTGTMAATTVTGANVTSGANPGHTHTGSSISALDAGDITTGTLVVARGGTGVTTSTGTGATVRGTSPTFTTKLTTDKVFINEASAATTDVAGDGQIWVKNNVPNDLWFTNDGGVDYPVGYAVYRKSSINVIDNINQTLNMTTDSVADAMVGGAWVKTNTTAYTLTLEPSTDTQFPVGGQIAIWNRGASGTMTVTEGSGTTLYVLTGSASTDAAGSATIAAGGYATLIRESTTVYLLMGAGITP